MPLIKITTRPHYYPPEDGSKGTPQQEQIAELGESLPALFVSRETDLHLDHDTPEAAVQVSHRPAHGRDINAPDIWILIEFSEEGRWEVEQIEVTAKVKQLLIRRFAELGVPEDIDYAVDVRWIPSHGFLSIGGVQTDW